MCSLFREKKKTEIKTRCVFARTEHKEISCWKLTNEGEGRFFWDTSEPIWVMKQMCMLHIRQLNSWLESGLLPQSPFRYTSDRRELWKDSGWIGQRSEGCFRFSRVTSSIPATGQLALAGGLSWGGVNREKGVGWKGFRTTPGGKSLQLHPLPVGGAPLNTCIRCLQFAIWQNEP